MFLIEMQVDAIQVYIQIAPFSVTFIPHLEI